MNFLLIFDQNVEYKRPVGAYPLHDFYKICRICTSFKAALAIKVSLDLLKGLWVYGGFDLTGSFVRYCGQGSSLLWTPALRPLWRSNAPAQGDEGNW